MLPAILGHVGDAEFDSPCGGIDSDRFTAEQNVPAVRGVKTEQDACKFGSPCANQTCKTENLSGPDAQTYIAYAGIPAAQSSNFQQRPADRHFAFWKHG